MTLPAMPEPDFWRDKKRTPRSLQALLRRYGEVHYFGGKIIGVGPHKTPLNHENQAEGAAGDLLPPAASEANQEES